MPLSSNDLKKVRKELGREINEVEEELFANLWSEHCAYRSSELELKNFISTNENVVIGPGDDAGVVKLPNGEMIAIGIESHNHPSYVDPYNGAATGVGGIIRDILSMGARPIALLDNLRFGELRNEKNQYLFNGVVSGISDYGNSVGVPTIGGDVQFSNCYEGNPLVNVLCIGKVESLLTAKSKEPGNKLVILGSSTGRDGLGGAAFASSELQDEAEEEERHSVQIGDPFSEKLLIECVLEMANKDLIKSCRDLGAAGLGGASSELCSKGNNGAEIFLDKIHTREEDMNALELLLSESQERMLLEVQKNEINEIKEITNKYDLSMSVIGELKKGDKYVIYFDEEKVVDLPVNFLTKGAPLYNRGTKEPNRKEKGEPNKTSIKKSLLELISDPNLGTKKWIYQQYDHEVQIRTVIRPGEADASLLRLNKNNGLALSSGSNSSYGYLDPYRCGELAVSHNIMDIATIGADPIALVDCLNFASPEDKEIYWEFKNTVAGMANIARKLDVPVVGGNVSFYNESEEKKTKVKPTPNVGVIGYLPQLNKKPSFDFDDEVSIYLVGETRKHLGASHYYKKIHGFNGGKVPKLRNDDLDNIELTKELVRNKDIIFSKNIKKGGLGTSLAKTALRSNKGLKVDLEKISSTGKMRNDQLLFSESPGRALILTKKEIEKNKAITKIGELKNTDYMFLRSDEEEIKIDLKTLKEKNKVIEKKMWD